MTLKLEAKLKLREDQLFGRKAEQGPELERKSDKWTPHLARIEEFLGELLREHG